MLYVSWNQKLEKLGVGDHEIRCGRCNSVQQFTIKINIDKTKLYGIATIRKKVYLQKCTDKA